MGFARKVWRLLVGIKDALALILLLLFFTALFTVLSARPNPGIVREGALLLDLNGTVVEEVAPIDPLSAILSQSVPVREYAARDLVHAIDAGASDDRIGALALDLSTFLGGGAVHMAEIADAIDRFRETGKPVYTYGIAYSDDAMALAAHADEIWIDPFGGVAVTGPGGENLYYKGALDRFNVKANVYRVGTYKSAVEPFTETNMSEPARENLSQLYATLWQEWRAGVNRARPEANIDLVTSDIDSWLSASNNDLAEAALAAGLADRIGTRAEWGERIAQVVGADEWSNEPGSFNATGFDPWIADIDDDLEFGKEGKVGVITVAGEISDGDDGPGSAGAARIERLLNDALDDDLDALVVRVDSPGGTVTGSETIRRAVMRHRKAGVPVAVSMGNYAASGGYWVSTAGQRIFAEPQTLTGSIGVFAVLPSFEGLLADYGINSDGVRTTGLSGQPDLLAGFTPEVDTVLQAGVTSVYGKFLALVAQSRNITPERADELGQGRVWDGGAARQLGLVDQFGDLDAAISWAAKEAELGGDSYDVVYLGEDAEPFGSIFARMLADDENARGSSDMTGFLARRETARLRRVVADFDRFMAVEGMQARCLECAAFPAASSPAGGSSGPVGWRNLFDLFAAFR
ncbi:signal peptide peptidase SppA [Aurantiacibacter spongiae]|uniref:Signal peptide peptidase SppA n=1 Tax=Aurantiacibacter spongiae TaxID=2488860 RepID=A0A3N5CZ21_9SPHN|nr:signal peptide peptidase SppA [Aurantiacibacter spongiae]RPF71949.1 signal peptide peptidase SppA [Aurantiacibacter spongiae]